MAKIVFVTLPVRDLARSTALYAALGATRNPRLNDETASCMVFSDTVSLMLLTHETFATFIARPIADARASCRIVVNLPVGSRAAVDAVAEAALAAGAVEPSPVDDHSFMYGRSFEAPDGHMFGVLWLDAGTMSG